MNRLDDLELLLDAGVTSLKIEGRLKDVSYVKNVTAAYRQKFDSIFRRRAEYTRASSGTCRYDFQPAVEKSFNRGFANYFLHGREEKLSSPDTPKAMGELMGTLKEQRSGWISVAGVKPFHNGDGVCYLDQEGRLQGFRINRVDGNKLYPAGEVPHITPRTPLYRNFDQEFERVLARKSAERKIALKWELAEIPRGFNLTATDEDNCAVTVAFDYHKEKARTPQNDNIKNQLSKIGNTIFETQEVRTTVTGDKNKAFDWFIPAFDTCRMAQDGDRKAYGSTPYQLPARDNGIQTHRSSLSATRTYLFGQRDEQRGLFLLSSTRSATHCTGF